MARKDTLSVPQACQVLKMCRDQVMQLIYLGKLDADQGENGRWRITRASVDTLTR